MRWVPEVFLEKWFEIWDLGVVMTGYLHDGTQWPFNISYKSGECSIK